MDFAENSVNDLMSEGDEMTRTQEKLEIGVDFLDWEAIRKDEKAEDTIVDCTILPYPWYPAYDELMAMAGQVRVAQGQIAEAAAMLRAIVVKTRDYYRGSILVAHLESLVGSGGWIDCDDDPLVTWANELAETARVNEIESEMRDYVVSEANGCPSCGEHDMDRLVWEDDGENVRCATCGTIYDPGIPPVA